MLQHKTFIICDLSAVIYIYTYTLNIHIICTHAAHVVLSGEVLFVHVHVHCLGCARALRAHLPFNPPGSVGESQSEDGLVGGHR